VLSAVAFGRRQAWLVGLWSPPELKRLAGMPKLSYAMFMGLALVRAEASPPLSCGKRANLPDPLRRRPAGSSIGGSAVLLKKLGSREAALAGWAPAEIGR
jgi:hypothetical protein